MINNNLNFSIPKVVKIWIDRLMDGDSIGDVLADIFAYNAAGAGNGVLPSRHDNFQKLVEFVKNQEDVYSTRITGNEKEIYHLQDQVDCICEAFDAVNQHEKSDYLRKIFYENGKYRDIYDFVLKNWEFLKDWSRTYRMLYDLVSMEHNWDCRNETLCKLIEILIVLSMEWNQRKIGEGFAS